GAPRNLGSNINTQGDECAPTIYGGFLYYTSRENRTNAPWILRAVRLYHLPVEGKVELGRNMSFDLPSPFNSLADNIEIAFDTVKGRIYLLTNRDGDMGLYLYEGRLPLTVAYGHISAPDGKRMSGVDVSLFAGEKLVGRTISDEEGRYRFLLNRETDYSLWVSRPGYFGNSVEIKATDEDELYAVLEQVFDVSLDRLELNTKQYIYDVFGPDASIELSARGKQKLMRIVRFLYENPHIKLNIGVISSASENEGLNNIVNARRIETLHQYLSQLLTHASINIYDARNEAVGRVRNAFNACLTVRLEE
ncbi:MAG: carboxypeptidase regulatory-like domain-containing protein, partial [Bacteroidales bacterium]|nr:carboxypeptidase regulatory-like domain-containing protein [Bacteroidales bacterium]